MNFSSDNTSPVPNQILDKIKGANNGHQASYGEDDYMCELTDRIKDIFETEEDIEAFITAAKKLTVKSQDFPQ